MSFEDKKKVALRNVYGETLVELGSKDKNIVVLDADLSCSTQTQKFAKAFPERFFNMGVAEQDEMSTAAGLSTCGKIPFVSTFAIFASGRAWDQVRNSIAYPHFNVKIIATHGGVTVGEDGATHQALEDISLMRSIPGMTVIVPSDAAETKAAIYYAYENKGPFYIRIPRSPAYDIHSSEKSFVNIEKPEILVEGLDVTLISNGDTLCEALICAEMLLKENIIAEVISVPMVKPLKSKIIVESAKKTGAVAIIEDHSIIGGLGSAVCEVLSEEYPTLALRIGTKDIFGQSGKDTELLAEYGLTAEKFISDIVKLTQRKCQL